MTIDQKKTIFETKRNYLGWQFFWRSDSSVRSSRFLCRKRSICPSRRDNLNRIRSRMNLFLIYSNKKNQCMKEITQNMSLDLEIRSQNNLATSFFPRTTNGFHSFRFHDVSHKEILVFEDRKQFNNRNNYILIHLTHFFLSMKNLIQMNKRR